jgi:outer membrane protein, heavy metal efflux system
MRIVRLTFVSVLLFATLLPARGVSAEALTMDEAVQQALAANPGLAAAQHEADAVRARAPQAATPPDPSFMVDFIGVPTNTADVSKGTVQYMVEQQIPFPSKLVYGSKTEKRAADAALSRKAATAQELTRQVKRAYLDLWRLGEEAKIEQTALAVLRESKGSAIESYATLKVGAADPVRASVELGELEGRVAVLEQQRLEAIAALSKLMATPLDPAVRPAPPPAPPPLAEIDELIAKAKAAKPEVSEAREMIASEQAKVSLAKSEYLPDLTLRWGFMDNPAGQPNAWYGRAGVSVPLWALSKQRFAVRESKAMLARAESRRDTTLLEAESEVKSAHARLVAAQRTAQVYGGTVLPRAKLLLSSSQEAYRSGKGDFLGVVDAIRSFTDAQVAHARARADASAAFADLERAIGAPLIKESQ